MDKRRLKFITWGFVLLTAVIVALMLMSNLRRSSRVELPDTENDAQGSENVPTEGSALTVVEVRPETVQAAIETLHRPQVYRRSVTVEYLWNSDSGTAEMTTAVLNGWTRVDRTLADGQTRHVITDGTVSYIWYNEESDFHTGASADISADAEQAIPTYEEILALPPETITQADYHTVSDVRCIYVETAEDEWGYTQRYWVSVDTGLLVVAERLYDGEPVYRMAALTVDQSIPSTYDFTLPDGTILVDE